MDLVNPLQPDELTQFSKPNSIWASLKSTSIILPIFIICGLIGASFSQAPLLIIPLFIFLGVYINKVIFLMHDCAHNSLFKKCSVNRFWGIAFSGLVVTNFDSFKKLHLKHHKFYCEDEDPQKIDYMGYHQASTSAIAWHLFRPLLGFNLFKVFQLNSATPSATSAKKGFPYLFLLSLVVNQILVFLLITQMGSYWYLYVLYPAAAGSIGLFCSQWRGFCEHIAYYNNPTDKSVRTHKTRFLEWLFFYDQNFNYHVEHHIYPELPSVHFPALHRLLQEKNTFNNENFSTSMISTVRKKLKDRSHAKHAYSD